MTREHIYDRLIAIDCSPETADAMAEALSFEDDNKIRAFFMWAIGYTYRACGAECGFSREAMKKYIRKLKNRIRQG